MMQHHLFQLLLVLTCVTSVFSETITDEQLGYSVFLPEGWNTTAVSSTQHRFEDTTGVYQSMIVINRYDFSADTVFDVAEDWTRANFIAYVFSIEADPFCALVYYDSVTARQNETLWATDVFSQFFSIDTVLGDWAEYIRFTASGFYGYEIYAIGPEADMLANVGMYVAIIDAIVIPETSALTVNRHLPRCAASVNGYPAKSMTVNALGRMVAGNQARASVNLLITGPVGTRQAVKAVRWR